jgi:hypothetical protein
MASAISARLAKVEASFAPERVSPRILSVVCDQLQVEEIKRLVEEAGYAPNDLCIFHSIVTPPASRDRKPVLPYVLHGGSRGSTEEDRRCAELFRQKIDQMAAEMRDGADASAIVLSPEDAEL